MTTLLKKHIYTYIKFWVPVTLGIIWCVGLGCKKKDAGKKEEPKVEVVNVPSATKISDLALIYHGGQHRMAWNSGQLKHYVFRNVNGKPEWLFDGFLFLEITSSINGHMYDFGISGPNTQIPGKPEWEWLLSRTFADGKGPDAIEATLDSLSRKGFPPPYKRKIVMAIPNPMYGSTGWGAIDHKALDFNKAEDRLKAANWYIDRVMDIWKSKKYKYIELSGFYWLHETIDSGNGDHILVGQIGDRLKNMKLDFNWIPYYGAERADKWKDLKFDVAYQQPNYFFSTSSPMSILTGGVDFGLRYNMQLEMEFDRRVEQVEYGKRFYDYIQVFQDKGVWDNKQVAYYDGDGAWYMLSISKDPELQKMAKKLGDIVAKRHEKAVGAMGAR